MPFQKRIVGALDGMEETGLNKNFCYYRIDRDEKAMSQHGTLFFFFLPNTIYRSSPNFGDLVVVDKANTTYNKYIRKAGEYHV